MDWLAWDFAASGHDMKHLLRRILVSRTYQIPSVREAPKAGEPYQFRGPLPRRLTAEQFADAISAITGEWRVIVPRQSGPARYAREWQMKSTPLTRALGRPIRDQVTTERLNLPTTLDALELANGRTLAELLDRGARRLLGVLKPAPAPVYDSGIMGAGKVVIDIDIRTARRLWLLVEDAESYDPRRVAAGWADGWLLGAGSSAKLEELTPADRRTTIHFRGDKTASEALAAPLPSAIEFDIDGKGFVCLHVVAGVDQKSIGSDINPRLRFFVFTEEPDRRQLIPPADQPPVPAWSGPRDATSLVSRVYRHALGRDPEPEERHVAREMLAGGRPEGLEDLLWSILLSPEFQYIR